MIHTLTFKDPESVNLPEGIHASYLFKLPSIKGKTFEFKPGLNVIVGKNGCGKSSLLKAIRALTFCDEVFASSIKDGRDFWEMHTHNSYENGYWHLAVLKAQYELRTFNLRQEGDFHKEDFCVSSVNFMQAMSGNRYSSGQKIIGALNMMLRYYKYGEGWERMKKGTPVPKNDDRGNLPHHYFKEYVLDVIEKQLDGSRSHSEYWDSMYKTFQEYYKENDDNTYKGVSFLMDEPDRGMDIENLNGMYEMFSPKNTHIQDIVVLHNVGLIHKFRLLGDKVNFIEMTDGYLDSVDKFFK